MKTRTTIKRLNQCVAKLCKLPAGAKPYQDIIRESVRNRITLKRAIRRQARRDRRNPSPMDLLMSYKGKILFWSCPKGCDGRVEWSKTSDGKNLATCQTCGKTNE